MWLVYQAYIVCFSVCFRSQLCQSLCSCSCSLNYRKACANNSFHTPLAEHVLLYTTTRNLSIPSRVSELTSTGCRDISREAYIADGQDLQANQADFVPCPRQLDTVSHPLTALKSIYAFSLTFLTISWIAICRK